MKYTYEDIVGRLRQDVVTVTFEKINGETREMACTLQESYIPNEMLPKGTGRAKTHDTVSAYDIKAQGWRSFRVELVKNIMA